MKSLERRVEPVEELKRGDIIEGVKVIEKEQSHNKEVYIYTPEIFPNSKGIIFPNDDIVNIGETYDVIINKVFRKYWGSLIMSQVYHDQKDLVKNGIKVKISKLSNKREPMFEIYGYRGFVIKGKADIGDKVQVKVLAIMAGNIIENFLKTEVISYIE